MSERAIELFLVDIIIAIAKIKEVSGRYSDPQTLKFDFIAWDSVIREFEIIGEAMRRLLAKNFFDKEKRKIVDFRNILAHEYFGIDEDEVWYIVHNYLDELKELIEKEIVQIKCHKRDAILEEFISDNSHLPFVTTTLKRLKCLQD